MNKIMPLLFAVLLTACGQSETPPGPATLTVDALAADPVRLKELRQQCKLDRAKLGDALCNRVAEATNKRFFGDGKVPYTPSKDVPKF